MNTCPMPVILDVEDEIRKVITIIIRSRNLLFFGCIKFMYVVDTF